MSVVSADKDNRMLYEARLKEWRDNKSRIDGAWAEGEARGIALGRAEGTQKVLDLMKKGYSAAEIEQMLS